MEIFSLLLSIIFFIALEAFFSGSEIAILSASRGKLEIYLQEEENSIFRKAIKRFLDKEEEFLSSTLFGYTISIVFAASAYTILIIKLSTMFPFLKGKEVLFSESLVIFTILLGEIIPKSFFQKYADKIIIYVIFILDKLRILFLPAILLANFVKKTIIKSEKEFLKKTPKDPHLTDRQILLKLISLEADIDEFESLIVSNIISFKDRRAGEIVRPLTELIMISENSNVEQAIEKIKESGYSRIPVYKSTINDIIGYVRAFDLLAKNPHTPIGVIVRPIRTFSEFTFLRDILKDFKTHREHIGVVVDERGVTMGIITIEDILSEIIGQIYDDIRKTEPNIKEISNDKWILDGKLEINDFIRITGFNIEQNGPYNTVGGFIEYTLAKIPKSGESIVIDDLVFKVIDSDRKKINKIMVYKPNKALKEKKR